MSIKGQGLFLLDEGQGQVHQVPADVSGPPVPAMELVMVIPAERHQITGFLGATPRPPVADMVNDDLFGALTHPALRVRHQVNGSHLDPRGMLDVLHSASKSEGNSTARAEGGDTEPAPRQHTQNRTYWSESRDCRHLGRVTASPDPGTSRGRRPEAPDGVAPVGAKLPSGEPKTWDGWDSVDRPAEGTSHTHPLTATFPGCARALGGSALGGQPLAIQGRLTTRRLFFGERNLPRAVKPTRAGPLVVLAGGAV